MANQVPVSLAPELKASYAFHSVRPRRGRKPNLPAELLNIDFFELSNQELNPKIRTRFLGLALLKSGKPCCEVADILKVNVSSVKSWLHRFSKQGLNGIQDKVRAGRKCVLPKEKEAIFRDSVMLLLENSQRAGLLGEDLRRILKEQFSAHYTLSGVYELLKRLNMAHILARSSQQARLPATRP